MSEFLTVVNRTSAPVETMWDGKPYILGPHEKKVYPELVALAFKRRNVQMGSLDMRTGKITFLVGIEENGDPITPIEQTDAIEVWNRNTLSGARPSEIVPGDNGLYSAQEWKRSQPLESSFSK